MVVTKLLCKWFKKDEVYLSDILDAITAWMGRNDRNLIYSGMILVMVCAIIKNIFTIHWSLSNMSAIIFDLLYEFLVLAGFIILSVVLAIIITAIIVGAVLACVYIFDIIHEKSKKVKLVQCSRNKNKE